jgi:hypothetical protein
MHFSDLAQVSKVARIFKGMHANERYSKGNIIKFVHLKS